VPQRLLVLAIAVVTAACTRATPVGAVYADDTRELLRLDYDYNADGIVDVRTYMRRGEPIRLEGDSDGDGLVDRWEYYGPGGVLVRLGGSSEGDGREDTWIYRNGAEVRVEISTRRDGIVNRREFFHGDVLLRTESDTNADGLPDTWEQYDGGTLAMVMVDEDKRRGRPTRRVIYAREGAPRIETDLDGDGRFIDSAKEGSDASR